jgi:hypothetical protein
MKLVDYGWKLYSLMPPAARHYVKLVLKGGSGHKSTLFNGAIAKRHAKGKCRLDVASRMFCDDLSASGISEIQGKRCLEIGTGYVGSSAVVMWLLGAKTVTSIDLNRIFISAALKEAVLSADKEPLFQTLKKYVLSDDSLRERINFVYDWARSARESISDYFSYLAPFDILTNQFNDKFDLLFSVSTLEHIPRNIVGEFLEKNATVMADGAKGLHFIDLTDHYDRHGNPLGFLSLEREHFSEDSEADARGNRIRASEWLNLFRETGLVADIVMSNSAPSTLLPEGLASPFNGMNREDLLVTSILLRVCR